MRRALTRLLALVAATALGVLARSAPASAHPLGNFTQNTYAGLIIGRDATRVDYVLDLAEIPAFQTRQQLDADADGKISDAEAAGYRGRECGTIAQGLALTVNDGRVPLRVVGSALSFPPGQAGLVTLRLECAFVAATGALSGTPAIAFEDMTLRDRIGWREITAVGDRTMLLDRDVDSVSMSRRLTSYPQGRIASPLRETSARLVIDPTHGEAATLPETFAGSTTGTFAAVDRFTRSFTGLIQQQSLTIGFGVFALLLSAFLGILHAAAPGHGKTVMAAYLVGRGGSTRHTVLLGLTVAVTHTIGVLAFGLLLSVSQMLAPERFYPVLGLLSGILFAMVGITLVPTALAAWRTGGHGHAHSHGHTHEHGHDGGHGHDHTAPAVPPSWRGMIAPGLAGGIVPSPSAVLVLIGAIALGRMWFGVSLVLAYGVGLAGALVGTGWVLVRFRDRLQRRMTSQKWARWQRMSRGLPLATAALVILGGAYIAARAIGLA
jgi:ABC-type nickel/cobalt efflux system permease component RcnA